MNETRDIGAHTLDSKIFSSEERRERTIMKRIDPLTGRGCLALSARMVAATKQHQHLRSNAGYTLIELIVVCAIIGALAALAIPAYNQFIKNVKVKRAISEIRTLEKDITARIADNNPLPNSLADINRENLLDPWGNPYQYLNFVNAGTPRQDSFTFDLNTDFDIYSLGFDGLTDTNIKAANSLDDIVRTSDGGWVGTGEEF
jgi:general secretion pathway protein G